MKKSLSQAIALATLLGAAGTASAVNVNPNGTGEVLLYPIYTTEAGNVTSVSITNTTDQYKAVKVRFVESLNSQEVYDFNLYLSPYDQWSGTVSPYKFEGETGWVAHKNGLVGAQITTADTSCTAPEIISQHADPEKINNKFLDFQYRAYSHDANGFPLKAPLLGDGGWDEIGRTRVGHVEVIEMGVVTDPSVQAMIKHGGSAQTNNLVNEDGSMVKGALPGNCNALRARFNKGQPWENTPGSSRINEGIDVPTGGLYGTGTVVNLEKNVVYGFEATAIANFWDGITRGHAYPGTVLPDLNSGDKTAFFSDGAGYNFSDSVDAVSAVLMKSAIQNDYLVGGDLQAETNWVVTYPTKKEYVNGLVAAKPPFTEVWAKGMACEPLKLRYWDNEEYTYNAKAVEVEDELLPSPLPPVGIPPAPKTPHLCYEANVIKFNDADVLVGGSEDRAVGFYNLPVREEFTNGWARIDFSAGHSLTADNGTVVVGLPVIGFAAMKVEAAGNLNMSDTYQHKSETQIYQ